MSKHPGRAALLSLAFTLVAVGGCTDPEAVARAEAEAKAATDKARADDKLERRLVHQAECLSALRWQKDVLARAGIGSVDLYTAHFKGELDKGLAEGQVFRGDPPQPMLSRATLEDYLEWRYEQDVRTRFAAGKDTDGDGKISARERNDRGYAIVAGCVQEVAEIGKGPLAGPDKVERMYRIQLLRTALNRSA